MSGDQLHGDNSQRSMPAQETVSRLTDGNIPSRSVDSSWMRTRSRIPTKSVVVKSRAIRIRFDIYDRFRQIPNRKHVSECG